MLFIKDLEKDYIIVKYNLEVNNILEIIALLDYRAITMINVNKIIHVPTQYHLRDNSIMRKVGIKESINRIEVLNQGARGNGMPRREDNKI
jgi:hypothetical protein